MHVRSIPSDIFHVQLWLWFWAWCWAACSWAGDCLPATTVSTSDTIVLLPCKEILKLPILYIGTTAIEAGTQFFGGKTPPLVILENCICWQPLCKHRNRRKNKRICIFSHKWYNKNKMRYRIVLVQNLKNNYIRLPSDSALRRAISATEP